MKKILLVFMATVIATTFALAQSRVLQFYKGDSLILSIPFSSIDSVKVGYSETNVHKYVDLGLRSTYKYCNGSSTTMTKYCNSSPYGTVDNKTTLELSDDVARASWGGSWRMPTYEEISELNTKCTWTWTSLNGTDGYKVTGPNGNSIFLPAAGYRDGESLSYAGSYGVYWSSSLHASLAHYARKLYFHGSGHSTDYGSRYFGRSVRPVTK